MSGTTEQLQIRKLQELVFNRVIADAERKAHPPANAGLRNQTKRSCGLDDAACCAIFSLRAWRCAYGIKPWLDVVVGLFGIVGVLCILPPSCDWGHNDNANRNILAAKRIKKFNFPIFIPRSL